ncbi:MAG: hypothetical protein COV91_02635 [Candidatus Taylorbacteria bacterium CG11_big_fil_rev_8_21_14_0_20_46_11]|uniref:D-alanyl-D-alanine carboxypeptidase-like core domain-containing protein n=1 Tax=Candidatus Taylorbacteria bacterium CG11_big_fil_rev_8_21_14_0_20_46_11 TaxID=1975025 RepID=A0A2H0KBT5_9BACT|nr:MAG: hypothetical protein COV91_02635 [Candidatus Taylorbacteria bacterium CG11_big_fil_rev_8_21_14_0_20_46_11]
MDNTNSNHSHLGFWLTGLAVVVLGSFLYYGFRQMSTLTEHVGFLESELASTTVALAENTGKLEQNLIDLQSKTTGLSDSLSSTQQNVDAVKTQVGGVEQTVGTISGTVGTLKKLSEIDPEILRKYSKVYFMNENYVPVHLTSVPADYLYSLNKPEEFLSEAWPYLQRLLNDAKAQNITLYVKSAYRSFGEQQSLKSTYSVIYGAGTANSFSADQGYSEHQLGTTVDFITSGLGGQLTTSFDKTEVFQWLQTNAYRYGFTLSYPAGNTYYAYEPWHWRFVGIKLATYLHDNNKHFYDMDQRDIDAYLAETLD